MWYEEYKNKSYTHLFRIDDEWYPCFIYHEQIGEDGNTTILTRNRSVDIVKNCDIKRIGE